MKKLAPLLTLGGLTIAALGGAATLNAGVRRAVALPDGAAVTAVANDVADAQVATAPRPSPRPPPTPAGPRVLSKQEYIRGILCRNIFDSQHIDCPEEVVAGNGAVGGRAPSDLDATLVGTLVAYPEQYSSAFIQYNGVGLGYGIGDRIADAELTAIEKNRVTLRRGDGRVEVLEMGKTATRSGGPVAAAAEETSTEGIQKLDETSFVVSRELLERYMNDVGEISKLGRAIPHRSGGEIDGYRLSGIRRGGVTDDLGIKNGDIVHAVNGQPLTSMQGAMAAFQALQSESSFNFEITRRGKKMTLEYSVR